MLKVIDTIKSVHLQTYGHMHPMWVSPLHMSKASDQTHHEFCFSGMLTNQKQIKAPRKEAACEMRRPKRVVLFSLLSLHPFYPLHLPSLQFEQPSCSLTDMQICKRSKITAAAVEKNRDLTPHDCGQIFCLRFEGESGRKKKRHREKERDRDSNEAKYGKWKLSVMIIRVFVEDLMCWDLRDKIRPVRKKNPCSASLAANAQFCQKCHSVCIERDQNPFFAAALEYELRDYPLMLNIMPVFLHTPCYLKYLF